MIKCIVSILAAIIIFVDCNDECFEILSFEGFNETHSGIDAFIWAYYRSTIRNITRSNSSLLCAYYSEIYQSAIQDFQDQDLLSPADWCKQKYENDSTCRNNLIDGGFKITILSNVTELSNLEALQHAYRHITITIVKTRNKDTQEYYNYIIDTYTQKLFTKRIKNPVEYCTNRPAESLPSSYAGHYLHPAPSNEHTSIQDQGRNENAREGSSTLYKVIMDNEGREIDLNKSVYNDEDQNI